jgi:hypothetical protein
MLISTISLPDDRGLLGLRQRYREVCTTSLMSEDQRYNEYRFGIAPTLRLTVLVAAADHATTITVTGATGAEVQRGEREVRALLHAAGVGG